MSGQPVYRMVILQLIFMAYAHSLSDFHIDQCISKPHFDIYDAVKWQWHVNTFCSYVCDSQKTFRINKSILAEKINLVRFFRKRKSVSPLKINLIMSNFTSVLDKSNMWCFFYDLRHLFLQGQLQYTVSRYCGGHLNNIQHGLDWSHKANWQLYMTEASGVICSNRVSNTTVNRQASFNKNACFFLPWQRQIRLLVQE